jgi:hypothetical protein
MSMGMDGTDTTFGRRQKEKEKARESKRRTIIYGFWIGVSPNGSCGI